MEYELYSQIFEENLRRMSEDDIVKENRKYTEKTGERDGHQERI